MNDFHEKMSKLESYSTQMEEELERMKNDLKIAQNDNNKFKEFKTRYEVSYSLIFFVYLKKGSYKSISNEQ